MSILRKLVAGLGFAIVMGVFSSAQAQSALTGPAGDGVYTPPPLPLDKRGSVIWTRPLDGTMALPSAARNILAVYRSVDDKGRVVPVSGTVAIPQGEAPRGGWPVITWTHGTTGLNAVCAPSRDAANGPERDYIVTIRNLLDAFVKKGYAVVASDYVGLGIDGFHPFLQGVPTGRNALDMLRAARAIEPKIGNRYAVMGHSQGGQVDLFTASTGPAYVPRVQAGRQCCLRAGIAHCRATRRRDQVGQGRTVVALRALHAAILRHDRPPHRSASHPDGAGAAASARFACPMHVARPVAGLLVEGDREGSVRSQA
jgi:pimeloyl-ACP methyl ester carboxylesterase